MVQPRARTKNVTSYRVIYGDTDQMGVVYYANYLRWFEKGRSEFLRQIDLPYKTIEEQGLHFPVTEVSCRYFRSARSRRDYDCNSTDLSGARDAEFRLHHLAGSRQRVLGVGIN